MPDPKETFAVGFAWLAFVLPEVKYLGAALRPMRFFHACLAVVAQADSKMSSKRTKVALTTAKKRRGKIGSLKNPTNKDDRTNGELSGA
jgi:DNA invertase Pin-like site-specific DNA recombinase